MITSDISKRDYNQRLTLTSLSVTIIDFNICYYMVKSLSLGMNCVFNLQIFNPKLSNYESCLPLDVASHVSETQHQAGKNLHFILWWCKDHSLNRKIK